VTRGAGQRKKGFSIRLHEGTRERLFRRARDIGGQPATLAERYIEEGLRTDDHPLVYFRDGAAGRRAAVLGSRLSVADVMSTFRQNEGSVEETAYILNLPPVKVEAALRYYADYREEIDDWIAAGEDSARRAEEAYRRGQEVRA
jgi:uncharacterized protein (DUF433 family)